jgi:hypothetical protein
MTLILLEVERGHLKHRFLIFLEPCTKDAIQSWALSACTTGPFTGTISSQQWVLIGDSTKVLSASFFYLNAQFTDQDVSGHHILVLPRHKCFSLIMQTLGV